MDPVLLAIPIGIGIGLIVGAVGGGGGVLGLPALVYLLSEPVGPASTTSLIVVAVAASVGAGALALRGHVCWIIALRFTVPAAAGSLVGTLGNHAVSAKLLILAFVPLTLVAAAATWRRAAETADDEDEGCPDWRRRPARLAVAALGVGVLTGFFGVGGGFMIVPVLTLWLGFGFRRAVATSLVILTLTGAAAVASHLAVGAAVNAELTFAMAAATATGALAGSILASRVPQAVLGRTFAVIVAALGAFLLADVLLLGGPPQG